MLEAREEDMKEAIPIPTDDEELRELGEDLRSMGCEGLLGQPWNVQEDHVLREFKFERGNQWIGTKRRDPENWTPNTWARVYGFQRGVGEGWAGRKDGLFAGKFRGEVDPKEGLHPSNCRNPREQRMLEFFMPILNPEKPKRISLTMANTLFGSMSGVRPVNWGLLIHEVVGRAIPNIGRKPSYLSPFLLHLYRRYDCITADEEDMLVIAAEEVAYKVLPVVADSSTSNDPIISEAPPSSPGSPPPMRVSSAASSSRRPVSPPPPPQQPQPEAGPSQTSLWRNVDLSSWDFLENPFKIVHDELDELQTQYHRLEHITKGASVTLGGCGPKNILRKIAKRTNRKEMDQVKTDNAHLHAQMASMAEKLGQKSEEIRKYHAEQTVVFARIWELIGHSGKIVNKARLYDQLVESGEPVSARQTISILVKYSRMMNNLFAEIQKVVPPCETLRRVLYQGPPGSPTGTLYEEVGKVALVQNPPMTTEPSQQGGGSGPGSSGKDPESTRSSQARRKNTGSTKTGRGQSPVPRTSDRSRTLDRARTPIRHQTPDREATQDRGKSHAHPATPTFPADCPMLEPFPTPPSRTAFAQDPWIASGGQHSEHPAGNNPAPSMGIRSSTVSGTPGSRTPRAEEIGDSEDEVIPSPNMRRALTRMQAKASPGSSSLVGGLNRDWKERAIPKKPRPS
jgi:hypothetical protein